MSKFNVAEYWDHRYRHGGNSGLGSHDINYINFKKNYINNVIKNYSVETVVELGCGDGNQLSYFEGYTNYTGYDISNTIILKCKNMFINDTNKSFTNNINDILNNVFDLSISLDVTYHLISDEMFITYMNNLFKLSDLVCLYTTNTEKNESDVRHIKHRKIDVYIENTFKNFKLIDTLNFNNLVGFFLYRRKKNK